MADRPTPEDPSLPPEEGADAGPPPPPTQPLPPATAAGAGAPPPPTSGPPPAGQPAWSAAGPVRPGAGPAAPRPSTPRRLWGEATATTGSRIALATAAVLAVLVVLTGIGLVGAAVVHRIDRAGFALGSDDDERGWMGDEHGWMGEHRGRPGDTPFGNNGRGNGNGNGRAEGRGDPGTGPGMPGRGRAGGEGPGAGLVPGLGTVLHGQFTTTLTGEPAVMLFQVGEATAVTPGRSLTLRSTDGFEATYRLDATTTGPQAPAVGDRVRVVAAEEGRLAVFVQVLGVDD